MRLPFDFYPTIRSATSLASVTRHVSPGRLREQRNRRRHAVQLLLTRGVIRWKQRTLQELRAVLFLDQQKLRGDVAPSESHVARAGIRGGTRFASCGYVVEDVRPVGPPKLLDLVRKELRLRHYSPRTEEAYVAWIRRFIVASGKRHPKELGQEYVTAFLSGLAARGVSASTQNQALSALLFL